MYHTWAGTQYSVESDKNTRKHNTQDHAGDHKAARNKDTYETLIAKRIQRNRIRTVSKKILDGLNIFIYTILTLNSDVDQEFSI